MKSSRNGCDEIPELTEKRFEVSQNKREVIALPLQKRKIGPTTGSISGRYPFRGEKVVQFESLLERDFIMRAEHFLNVLDIVPQPVQISYLTSSGRESTYTPDFLVVYRVLLAASSTDVRSLLIEVKPKSLWQKNYKNWFPKWKAAHRFAKDQGWEFHIRDETRIRDRSFENIMFLRRYKRFSFPPEISGWVLKTVESMGVVTVSFLLAKHFLGAYRAEGISHIWHLIATRRLECDIGLELGESSELWIPNHG